MAKRQRDVGKERYWREVLGRQVNSGLSVRAFCQQESVAESAFYSWRQRIRQRDSQACDAQAGGDEVRDAAIEKSPASDRNKDVSQAAAAFVPMVVADQGNAAPAYHSEAITIELCGGRILRLPAATAVSRLAELIHALESNGHEVETNEAAKTSAAEAVR